MGQTIRITEQGGGGGTGAVDAFNNRTGFVVPQTGDYNTSQVTETTNEKYVTDAQKTIIDNTSGTNTGDETAATIKTKYESNADTNAYTDSEKTKLSGLESSKFLGEFVSLVALQTAFPSPSIGSYAYVDTGAGQDVEKYLWDSTDSQYVLQQGSTTEETPASIKSKYESNANTNAFTDTEKATLADQSGVNTGDETPATIKTKYESNSNTNAFTDSEQTNLGNQSNTNTGDETAASVKTKYESNSDTNAFTDSEKINLADQSGINTGNETTASIQTKRPLKTVDNITLEGSGNIPLATYSKIVVFDDSLLNNFNTNVFTDVPGMQMNIDRAGNYTFVGFLNCNNDQNEEIDLTIGLTPITNRVINLPDGTTTTVTAGTQFVSDFQAVRDAQKKNVDQTLTGTFLLDSLEIGDIIDFLINTRNDNVDLSNRRAFGYTVNRS